MARPSHSRKQATVMPVLSDQRLTKSTIWSRRVVGNPESVQSSPRAFFSWTCSSMSSERTSCLRCSLASRSAIFWSLASVSALRRLSLAGEGGLAVLEEGASARGRRG